MIHLMMDNTQTTPIWKNYCKDTPNYLLIRLYQSRMNHFCYLIIIWILRF